MYNWYFVINRAEFIASGLVSKEVESFLTGIGRKTFLVTNGNVVSVTIDEVMLTTEITGDNPFVFGGKALMINADDDIYYGVPQ